ncbi:MAG: hypothetical protein ACI3VU_04080 [Faecousia sp.]
MGYSNEESVLPLRRDEGCSTESRRLSPVRGAIIAGSQAPIFPSSADPSAIGAGKSPAVKGIDFACWEACETGESLKTKGENVMTEQEKINRIYLMELREALYDRATELSEELDQIWDRINDINKQLTKDYEPIEIDESDLPY